MSMRAMDKKALVNCTKILRMTQGSSPGNIPRVAAAVDLGFDGNE